MRTYKIITFGDSNTQGEELHEKNWVNLLQKYNQHHFLNKGINGNTTNDACIRLKADVLIHQPDIVFIMFGTNDATISIEDDKPFVPLDQFRKNVLKIIDKICAIHAIPVLMTVIPVIEGDGSDGYYLTRHKSKQLQIESPRYRINQYNDITREIAKNNDYLLIDIWNECIALAGGESDLLLKNSGLIDVSGTHLTEKGASFIAQLISKELERII